MLPSSKDELAAFGQGTGLMGLPDAPRQLVFELDPRENFAREDFLCGPGNAAALDLVESWPNWPARTLALVGPEGSGKSHLAAIWAAAANAGRLVSPSLDEAAVPSALSTGALVIERVDAREHGDADERAMFHLLNLAREQGAFLLITARTAPAAWPIGLPDLASRLRALPVVALAGPDDTLLRAVLVKLFADRQLAIDDSLISFLVVRIERSFAAAQAIVAALDREALRRRRPVTRALAGEILGPGGP